LKSISGDEVPEFTTELDSTILYAFIGRFNKDVKWGRKIF